MKDKHEHVFKDTTSLVPLRRWVFERGRGQVKDLITGKDVLKQRKCKCGAVETYDLERKLA